MMWASRTAGLWPANRIRKTRDSAGVWRRRPVRAIGPRSNPPTLAHLPFNLDPPGGASLPARMHGHHHHPHGAHDHAHDHAASPRTYGVALVINLAFVVVQIAAGFAANSTALLADATHNLSDVLGLALSGGAAWLATRAASTRRTYGFGKAGVLAALANALLLVAASGAIGWEALRRFAEPEAVAPMIVMATAAAGIVVNGGTALMFARGGKHDINARGAFLHLMADAAVSAGVIVAGALIWLTGHAWIDPAASVIVVAVIVWGAGGLLRDSLDLAMDAAPAGIDVAAVRATLAALPGVTAVHDLHVWAMSPAEPALTAHLVMPGGGDDTFLTSAEEALRKAFGIRHVTLQIERAHREPCAHGHA
jgi:cobalt-zinc-cadmium efflux system protein